jgi:hypothetical protein
MPDTLPIETLWLTILRTQPMCLWVRWRGRRKHSQCTAFPLTGTLLGLAVAYQEGRMGWSDLKIPAGIWIDRLEECPEELAGASDEEVRAIVAELRKLHPDGV